MYNHIHRLSEHVAMGDIRVYGAYHARISGNQGASPLTYSAGPKRLRETWGTSLDLFTPQLFTFRKTVRSLSSVKYHQYQANSTQTLAQVLPMLVTLFRLPVGYVSRRSR